MGSLSTKFLSVLATVSLVACSGGGGGGDGGDEGAAPAQAGSGAGGGSAGGGLPDIVANTVVQTSSSSSETTAPPVQTVSQQDLSSSTSTPALAATAPVRIKGKVINLVHSEVTLTLNGSENLVVSASGASEVPFKFQTQLEVGSPFSVALTTLPESPVIPCQVSGGTGTIAATSEVIVSCAELQSIEVYADSTQLARGTGTFLEAVGIYSFGSLPLTDYVSWSLSNSNGSLLQEFLTGESQGFTDVLASFGGVLGVLTVEITAPSPSSIVITPSSIEGAVGDSFGLSATVLFDDGSIQTLGQEALWTVDDGSGNPTTVATLDTSGYTPLLLAAEQGSGAVNVTFEGVSSSRVFTISAKTVASVEVAPLLLQGNLGATGQLAATAIYDDGTTRTLGSEVVWASGDDAVATVSSTGLVSYVGGGQTAVTANVGPLQAQAQVIVQAASLNSVTIQTVSQALPVDESIDLVAIAVYDDGTSRDVTVDGYWSSADTSKLTVSNGTGTRGRATGVAAGDVDVSFSFDGMSSSEQVTVELVGISSISISPGAPMLAKGIDIQLTATAHFTNGSQIPVTDQCLFSSSDTALGTFLNVAGSYGYLNNVSESNTTASFTVTADCSGTVGSADVVITPATLVSLTLNHSDFVVNTYSQVALKAFGQYDDGGAEDLTDRVVWASSDGAVLHVSSSAGYEGEVTALAQGSATISVSLAGQTASITGTVDDSASESTEIQGNGLTGVYSSVGAWGSGSPDMGQLTEKGMRIDADVNFSWGSGSSPLGVGDDFYIKWTGYIKAPATGAYSIRTLSDDGVRLTLNNIMIINNWTLHGSTWDMATVNLQEGKYYPVELEFFERGGSAVIQLHWVPPGGSLESIPTAQLFSADTDVSYSVELVSIDLTPPIATASAGSSISFWALGIYDDGSSKDISDQVAWSVDNGLLTINQGSPMVGQLNSQGASVVTAALDGKSATTAVTILAPAPSSIVVTGSATMPNSETQSLTAIAHYDSGETTDVTTDVTWTSSQTGFATVDAVGVVTGVGAGSLTISANLGGTTGTLDIEVEDRTLTSLQLSPENLMLSTGVKQTFTVTKSYGDGSTWSASGCAFSVDDGVDVTLGSATGVMEHTSAGPKTVNVTASCEGESVTTSVFLTAATLASIQFDVGSLTLNTGSTYPLKAIGVFSDGASQDISDLVTFTRDDASVLHVANIATGEAGLVTALAEGVGQITAQYQGALSSLLTVTVSDSAPEVADTIGTGLVGSYYGINGWVDSQPDEGNLSFVGQRTDATVNFNWASGAAPMGVGDDFLIRWHGRIKAEETGTYTLGTISDDGVRLTVDSQSIVSNWTFHGATLDTGTIDLVAGAYYDVVLEFFERGGQARIELYWQPPSAGGLVIIPSQNLFE